jgi:2-polyprenyl-3-methyl-5-hydroxy-6-metoxy-1,4-benzoquinol methylase
MVVEIKDNYTGSAGSQYFLHVGQNEVNHLGHRLNSKFFLPYLTKHMDVLDFGSGNGSLAKIISQNVKSCCGIEVNEHARNVSKAVNNIKTFASISEAKGEGKKFDAIISNHVFEHIHNPRDTIIELCKLLKQGGTLILMLPIDDFRNSQNKNWATGNVDRHLHTWTPLLLGNTLEDSGLSPQKIEIVNYAWSYRFFFLGDGILQKIVCNLLSKFLRRRQLFAIAQND